MIIPLICSLPDYVVVDGRAYPYIPGGSLGFRDYSGGAMYIYSEELLPSPWIFISLPGAPITINMPQRILPYYGSSKYAYINYVDQAIFLPSAPPGYSPTPFEEIKCRELYHEVPLDFSSPYVDIKKYSVR